MIRDEILDEIQELDGPLLDRLAKVQVCSIDGYLMNQTCVCGHGHDRHTGRDYMWCMSYHGQADCSCEGFKPKRVWGDASGWVGTLGRFPVHQWAWVCREHVHDYEGGMGQVLSFQDGLTELLAHFKEHA